MCVCQLWSLLRDTHTQRLTRQSDDGSRGCPSLDPRGGQGPYSLSCPDYVNSPTLSPIVVRRSPDFPGVSQNVTPRVILSHLPVGQTCQRRRPAHKVLGLQHQPLQVPNMWGTPGPLLRTVYFATYPIMNKQAVGGPSRLFSKPVLYLGRLTDVKGGKQTSSLHNSSGVRRGGESWG